MRGRPLAWMAGAALFVIALAGCGKVSTDIAVYADGTYDMNFVIAASEEDLASAGQSAESFIPLLTEQVAAIPGIDEYTVSDYQLDGFAGIAITGFGIPGDQAGMFGRGVVSLESDGLHFDLQFPITIVNANFTPEQTAAIEVTTTVMFPAPVTTHNGTLVDDHTVRWTGDASADLDYTAISGVADEAAQPTEEMPDEAADEPTAPETAEADTTTKDDGVGWILPIGVGVGALAIIGLVIWLVIRSRSKSQ